MGVGPQIHDASVGFGTAGDILPDKRIKIVAKNFVSPARNHRSEVSIESSLFRHPRRSTQIPYYVNSRLARIVRSRPLNKGVTICSGPIERRIVKCKSTKNSIGSCCGNGGIRRANKRSVDALRWDVNTSKK